ncbi:MAG: hypothetical protein GY838_09365 [bacterium]|nr:hypothetical protein [bacterium]
MARPKLSIMASMALVAAIASAGDLPAPTPPPSPELFAPGIVSTDKHEFGLTVTADWRELYFTRLDGESSSVLTCRRTGDGWSDPIEASFSNSGNDSHPYLAPGRGLMVFTSRRPCPGAGDALNIWFAARNDDGWAPPHSPGPPLTDRTVHAATMGPDGTIWATGLVRFSPGDEGYAGPARPVPPLAGSHPTASPDGSWLVFSARGTGSVGGKDLYVVRLVDGRIQGEPTPLAGGVNSSVGESSPTFSGDGTALFFSRGGQIYWVATDTALPSSNREEGP